MDIRLVERKKIEPEGKRAPLRLILVPKGEDEGSVKEGAKGKDKEKSLPLGAGLALSPQEKGLLEWLEEEKIFMAKEGEVYASRIGQGEEGQALYFVGLGKAKLMDLVDSFSSGLKAARKERASRLEVILPEGLVTVPVLCRLGQACILSAYRFDRYKTDKDEDRPQVDLDQVLFLADKAPAGLEPALKEALVLAEKINWARDLVNEPANLQPPESLAADALTLAEKYDNVEVEVMGPDKISDLGMGAFLAVAQSAKNPPRFIVVRYKGDPGKEGFSLGIAGKGIVYDTGGLSLKPSQYMLTMKTDMAGAAASLAALAALAENQVPVNVVGVVAACENDIGGGNYRPGDIITSMSGKTIYVANTDAEGRLTLADAVTYLQDYEKPERLVDIATLTGAAEVALGNEVITVVASDDALYEQLEAAVKDTKERIWRLPAWDIYKKLNETTDADISNSGGRYAGAITAGLFVGAFVKDLPWAHLDIAGPSYTEKPSASQAKGATGSGVRALYGLAQSLSQDK